MQKSPCQMFLCQKTTRHTILTFKIYRLENKLPQELGEEMYIIISNAFQSKISLSIKLMWDEQHELKLVTTMEVTFHILLLPFHIYIIIKQTMNF